MSVCLQRHGQVLRGSERPAAEVPPQPSRIISGRREKARGFVPQSGMLTPDTYRARRARLSKAIGSGLVLFLGNDEVGMNYTANVYPFRQDSTFLYFWALDQPGLAAVIDIDAGTETVFGDDVTMADVVWSGPQPTIASRAAEAGVKKTAPSGKLADVVQRGREEEAAGALSGAVSRRARREARGAHRHQAGEASKTSARSSFHKAVAAQRLYKTPEEVADIEMAVDVSREMYAAAMRAAKPGLKEYESSPRSRRSSWRAAARTRFRRSARCTARRCTTRSIGTRSASGRRPDPRLRRRNTVTQRERHHAHDSGRRHVLLAAARDLRRGAPRADGRDRRDQTGRALS